MAVKIVQEIQSEAKQTIAALLPTYSQLDYEYNVEQNNDYGYEKKFGFIPLAADFVEGSALGHTTMDHAFQLILVNCFSNQDDDTSQNAALNELYENAHVVTQDLQKFRITLPTPDYKVLLISGLTFEEPEYNLENESVVLRANFNIRYRFRNRI